MAPITTRWGSTRLGYENVGTLRSNNTIPYILSERQIGLIKLLFNATYDDCRLDPNGCLRLRNYSNDSYLEYPLRLLNELEHKSEVFKCDVIHRIELNKWIVDGYVITAVKESNQRFGYDVALCNHLCGYKIIFIPYKDLIKETDTYTTQKKLKEVAKNLINDIQWPGKYALETKDNFWDNFRKVYWSKKSSEANIKK